MSTATPPAQPAALRVVSTRQAFDIVRGWADAHPQDPEHNKTLDELEELAKKEVWDDWSRTNEIAERLNALLVSIGANVRTAAVVQTPASPRPIPPSRQPTAQPARPAVGSFWRRLIVAVAIVAVATGVGLAGAVVGATNVALAATGGLGGLTLAAAAVAVRRGGIIALAAAGGLIVVAAASVGAFTTGHAHLTGSGAAAVLAGAGVAALLAGGDELVAAIRIAADNNRAQRPQR